MFSEISGNFLCVVLCNSQIIEKYIVCFVMQSAKIFGSYIKYSHRLNFSTINWKTQMGKKNSAPKIIQLIRASPILNTATYCKALRFQKTTQPYTPILRLIKCCSFLTAPWRKSAKSCKILEFKCLAIHIQQSHELRCSKMDNCGHFKSFESAEADKSCTTKPLLNVSFQRQRVLEKSSHSKV